MKMKLLKSTILILAMLALLPEGLAPLNGFSRAAAQAPEVGITLYLPIITHTTLTPAAGKVVFTSKRDKNWEIFAMNPNGSGVDQLTTTAISVTNNHPVWSPDGTRIAYASDLDGDFDIYVMKADGSEKTKATNNTTNDYAPAWSPDGKKIAFVSERNSTGTTINPEIYVMDATKATLGQNQKRLTDDTADDYAPAWSPDGDWIVFVSTRDDGDGDLYVMAFDGTDEERFLKEPGGQNSPVWSPDGNKIAFESDASGSSDIWVINENRTGKTNLTKDAFEDFSPAWSPNSAQIIFASKREADNFSRLYIMSGDGLSVIRVTDAANSDTDPNWNP